MDLKHFVGAAFVAFAASVATIGIMARLSPGAGGPRDVDERVVSAEELARHSSASDCWMAIEGGVYALSDCLSAHPAPQNVMSDWCGKEATEAFRTKGLGRPHGALARGMLDSCRVGLWR